MAYRGHSISHSLLRASNLLGNGLPGPPFCGVMLWVGLKKSRTGGFPLSPGRLPQQVLDEEVAPRRRAWRGSPGRRTEVLTDWHEALGSSGARRCILLRPGGMVESSWKFPIGSAGISTLRSNEPEVSHPAGGFLFSGGSAVMMAHVQRDRSWRNQKGNKALRLCFGSESL